MSNPQFISFVIALTTALLTFSGSATAMDSKTAYELGYQQGYSDGVNSGGGGSNDINRDNTIVTYQQGYRDGINSGGGGSSDMSPGDTMVIYQPRKGGGSSFLEAQDRFLMVYNGSSWTGFSQMKDGQNDEEFLKDLNFKRMEMGENTGVVWSFEPEESVSSQMDRLVGATGVSSEKWLKLLESDSPELSAPGLKKYEMVSPLLQK